MIERERRRRFRPGWAGLAVLLVVVGAGLLVVGLRDQKHPPQPPASAAGPIADTSAPPVSPAPSTSRAASTKPKATTRGPILPASTPVSVSVPSIGVSSALLQLGLNPDHTVQVPPLSRNSQAGWYDQSPTPGQLGPAIILGHVDSAEYGAGVFFKLGAVRPGDTVTVTRADHTVAVFRVDSVASYPKDTFPTFKVYGNTDHAALRLITCGGKFDLSSHNYLNNIVVYASLVSSHKA